MKKEDLNKFKDVVGFNLWQAEKDYLQHLFLFFLSRKTKNELVFKGGTALQKTFGLNRFSIDLDFTLAAPNLQLVGIVEKIINEYDALDYHSSHSSKETNVSETFFIKTQGPLYLGSEASLSTLRVEVSKREPVVLPPEFKEIKPAYSDVMPYTLLVMDLKEILAEKIRAIMTRKKPRDAYDAYFLLQKKVELKTELLSKKLEYYDIEFSEAAFEERLASLESIWEKELSHLMAAVPNYLEVKNFLTGKIKAVSES